MTRNKLTGTGLLLSVCILVGCDAEEHVPVPVPVTVPVPKTETGTETETDSLNTLTYSYLCKGEVQAIVVTLAGDGGYLFSPLASQPLLRDAGTGAFIGNDVYYLPEQPTGLEKGQSAQITILGNDFVDCKNDPRAAVWEAAKLRGVSYRAIGQEPPWVLDIDREKGFLLSTGYQGNKFEFPYTQPESDSAQRSSTYRSELNGEPIYIIIKGEPCHDSMSGEAFSSRVEIQWRTQTLHGCGRPLH